MKRFVLTTGATIAATILLATPVFANENEGARTASSTKPVIDKTAMIACVGAAVNTREIALGSAMTTYAGALTSAYTTRATALKAAYAQASTTSVRSATKAAWSAFTKSTKEARKAWKSARDTAWKAYRTTAVACKPVEGLGDGSNSGSEVSGG